MGRRKLIFFSFHCEWSMNKRIYFGSHSSLQLHKNQQIESFYWIEGMPLFKFGKKNRKSKERSEGERSYFNSSAHSEITPTKHAAGGSTVNTESTADTYGRQLDPNSFSPKTQSNLLRSLGGSRYRLQNEEVKYVDCAQFIPGGAMGRPYQDEYYSKRVSMGIQGLSEGASDEASSYYQTRIQNEKSA